MKKLTMLALLAALVITAACGGGSGSGGGDPYIGTWHLESINGVPVGGVILQITSSSTFSLTVGGKTTHLTYTRTGNQITYTGSDGQTYYGLISIDSNGKLHFLETGYEWIYIRAS